MQINAVGKLKKLIGGFKIMRGVKNLLLVLHFAANIQKRFNIKEGNKLIGTDRTVKGDIECI